MDLAELLDENELQQDEWSLTAPKFGEEGQLTVVGWSGRNRKGRGNKYYILKCSVCSQDSELFKSGYFRIEKGDLVKGGVPCGCAKYSVQYSPEQYTTLCSRKAVELGYRFLGFEGEWKGAFTKINMFCDKHGEWRTGIISSLVNEGVGCPDCGVDKMTVSNTKPDKVMITSFFESGCFHPDTKFWRSERLTKQGSKSYWYMHCPKCGHVGEATSSNLQQGYYSCICSKHRQQECYISMVLDGECIVALKFGIANNSRQRANVLNSTSSYKIDLHMIYKFQNISLCKKAERECKKELETGVVLKRDMPDGYTETTWVYNLDKIIEIYQRNGGVRFEY